MVATSNPLAVEAALWALGEGGTAVDAAIASDAVLGVVQPMSTGIGGDLFCLVDDGTEVSGFNGSGAAPRALTLERCTEEDAWHNRSALTCTVPGAVDGWSQLMERYGRLGLARVLEPARQLARDGFPIGHRAAVDWRDGVEGLLPCPFAIPVAPGQRFANPELAESLAAIGDGGPSAHYGGAWGKAAVDALGAEGGVMDGDDLVGHRGEWVTPISTSYYGHDVIELPPNGQGAAVLTALNLLDGEPIGDPLDAGSVVQIMTAVRDGMRVAHHLVADPRVVDVPPFWERRDTVFTAVVAGGMAVSLISSVFMAFGTGICAGGAALQNRGLGFVLKREHPNVVAGGKRPFHTIIPALVRRDGATKYAFGVIGGPMQPQGHVQVLVSLLARGYDPARALSLPRAFWVGGPAVGLEPGFPRAVADAFRAEDWEPSPDFPSEVMGVGQVIRVHDDGWLEGASDPRHDGVAFGV